MAILPDPKLVPDTTINHIAVNDRIGRISVGGMHKTRPVNVVIEPGEVPETVTTQAEMTAYLIERLQQKAEEKS